MALPSGDTKYVAVTITNDTISVVPEDLAMGKGKNKVVQWEIQTKGWTFPEFEDGVVFKTLSDQFSNGHSDSAGKHYILRNKNSRSQRHPYTISVTNGSTTMTLDPSIVNES